MTGFTETKFDPRACGRCGEVIIAGVHDGLTWRVDLGVGRTDAPILDHYGHGVVLLANRPGGLWAVDYDPGREPAAGTYLAASHICGSAHARQLAEGNRWNSMN